MINYKLIEKIPDVNSYLKLRNLVGWGLPEKKLVKKGLKKSCYNICAVFNDKIIGIGRIIGDNAFTFVIVDIIVNPKYQRNGIGSEIMKKIMKYLKNHAPKNSFITLMAAKNKEKFYEKFGFIKRPTEEYGHGMMLIL